ncbi:MAG: anthranilate synthase family protein [Pseudonocardiaceae bacterium]
MQHAAWRSAPETAHDTAGTDDQLQRIMSDNPPPFALLHRPESTGPDQLELLIGDVRPVRRLADLPLPTNPPGEPGTSVDGPRHDVLALVPFRQVQEHGFECHDDGEPILAMTVVRQCSIALAEALHRLPTEPVELSDAGFDVPDGDYAALVREVLAGEIGSGAGSNFVIKRNFQAQIPDYTPRAALALLRGLLTGERGAYWTFLVHTGDRTFVGATPERQVSVVDGEVVMNPISGTYRFPPSGPTVPGTLAFLSDHKEAGELCMVVDEELKMMASVCDGGGWIVGPHLKEMARLAHTEYLLHGRSSRDVREVLRGTLVAPTVTGSPVQNACRVLARYEPAGRGYYSGVIALIGRDTAKAPMLDSAILIRTADIDSAGAVRIGVGATLVRDSDPDAEVAETRAKAAALLAAFGADASDALPGVSGRAGTGPRTSHIGHDLAADHRVRAALRRRNGTLARYWFDTEEDRRRVHFGVAGRQALVLDAEDTFTAMLAQQLRSLELAVTVRPCVESVRLEEFDLVIAGPGPGDPRDSDDTRIGALWDIVGRLLRSDTPFLCVCLSHQVLASSLGLELVRKSSPAQGVQHEIDLFGRRERVGFYNTFAARSQHDVLHRVSLTGPVKVSRDQRSGEVHALRGPGFASTQFHPESLLTQNGIHILAELIGSALTGRRSDVLERSG